jgi:hypothetical protein
MMRSRGSRVRSARWSRMQRAGAASIALGFVAVAPLLSMIRTAPALALAQTAPSPGSLPDTAIAPAPEGGTGAEVAAPTEGGKTWGVEAPADEGSTAPAKPVSSRKPASAHRSATHHTAKAVKSGKTAPAAPADVEAAKGKLRLKQDSWAYSRPSKSARRIEPVHAGKILNVTGINSSYVRVVLKNGSTAYVPAAAVDLTEPTDKVFQLTSDAPVLSEPSHYGKKISEVHKGHEVHVVGLSLNYLKIRMRDGVEGFIAMTALE